MFWTPQPGPQVAAATSPCKFTLYGGARGGGKTDCAIGRHIRKAELYGSKHNGIVIRRKYKDFKEMRRRWDELIQAGLPAVRIGGETQVNFIRFDNGAVVKLQAIGRIEEAADEQGQQYTEVTIEEGATLPFFAVLVELMKGCLRSPHGVPCHIFVTANPGGSGHMQVKSLFRIPTGIDTVPPGRVFRDEYDFSYVFIQSFVYDNKVWMNHNPDYVHQLESIRDPVLRAAWLEGDWDIYLGQAFGFDKRAHVINPVPVPEHAPLYMTFDWGWSHPFSIGWWWVDNDGRAYRFGEWYGCGKLPDEGLKMTDSDIALGIKERERKMGIAGRQIVRLAGPDCFSKVPDRRGGGQGPSTSEVFSKEGLYLTPGDVDRSLKIRQFRERMKIPLDAEGKQTALPMMVVYDTCSAFIRTIPALSMDPLRPEDIDTDQEDHVYDEACHIAMARPIGVERPAHGSHRLAVTAKKGPLF